VVTAVNRGNPQPAAKPEPVLRAGDRRKLERAAERRRRSERELDELVRELFDGGASAIELAEALGITRHGVYKMLKRTGWPGQARRRSGP
jgi:DNA invertase Pin-like site-specific DNA recombinase